MIIEVNIFYTNTVMSRLSSLGEAELKSSKHFFNRLAGIVIPWLKYFVEFCSLIQISDAAHCLMIFIGTLACNIWNANTFRCWINWIYFICEDIFYFHFFNVSNVLCVHTNTQFAKTSVNKKKKTSKIRKVTTPNQLKIQNKKGKKLKKIYLVFYQ